MFEQYLLPEMYILKGYIFYNKKDQLIEVPIDIFTYTKSLEYDYPMYYYLRNDGKEIGDEYYDEIEVLVTLRNYTMIYDQSNFAN